MSASSETFATFCPALTALSYILLYHDALLGDLRFSNVWRLESTKQHTMVQPRRKPSTPSRSLAGRYGLNASSERASEPADMQVRRFSGEKLRSPRLCLLIFWVGFLRFVDDPESRWEGKDRGKKSKNCECE